MYICLRSWHGSNKENQQLGCLNGPEREKERRFDYRMKEYKQKQRNKQQHQQQQRNQLLSKKKKKVRRSTQNEDEKKNARRKITLNTYSPLTDGLLKLYAFRKENKINEREKMK